MDKMEQGETYNEVELGDDGLPADPEAEGAEDSEYVPDTIMGIPKNKVFMGVVVIILIIMLLCVFALRSKNKSNDVSNDTFEYDTSGDIIIEDFMSETYEDDYSYDESVPEEEVVLTVYDLSSEEQIRLRKAGYSADEINYALEHGFNVDDLVAAANELYDAAAKEALARMSNTAGAEYKNLMNSTYLGQKHQEFVDQSTVPEGTSVAYTTTQVINTDYTKCDTNGTQLFLKCKIGEGVYYWYQCTPQRWASLPQAGNIVLRFTFSVYGECLFVVDCTETDPTLDTIDSSQDIYEVITE